MGTAMRIAVYVLTALTVVGSQAKPQAPQAGEPKQDAQPSAQSGSDAVAARHLLSLSVVFSDRRPVRAATALVTPVGATSVGLGRGGITDSVGHITFDSLIGGDYDVRVSYAGQARTSEKRITVDGRTSADILVPSPADPSPWWTIAFLALYLIAIMLARWHNIASSLLAMLDSTLSALKARLVTEVETPNASEKVSLTQAIADIEKSIERRKERPWRLLGSREFLFWSRGRENAAWAAIHEVERQLAAYLSPPERVLSYLHVAHAQLRAINNPPAIAVADAIRATLPSQAGEVSTKRLDDERRALLGRAIALCYEDRDKQFTTLMEWQNKASWLVVSAILIIGFLALAAGHTLFFLAGGAGGFLSRVMRALKREDVPLDYGASWTTLFLSPLFGALAGWFGVAIITLATQPNVNLLGDAFDIVDWNMPTGAVTLSVAFLLGFSERFFDAVVGAVDRHAAGVKAAEDAAKAAGSVAGQGMGRPALVPPGEAEAKPTTPPPASVGKASIVLKHGPMPVQTVAGKVTLANPVTTDTRVTLSTSREDFTVRPADLKIAAGDTEAGFDLVPSGDAPEGTIRVTARIGNVTVSEAVEFTGSMRLQPA